jgi:hypothetical protein
MDQGELEHIGGFREPIPPREQLGTAHREELLCAEARDIKARPVAVTMSHGKVDILAREVDMMQRRRHTQIDARMFLGEAAQAVDQPFRGKVR